MIVKHKYIKLDNGEEIVSKVHLRDWEKYSFLKLEDPMSILIVPPPFGREDSINSVQVGLSKWIPYTSDDFILLPMSKIVIVADVDKSLVVYYNNIIKDQKRMYSTPARKKQERPSDLDDNFISGLLDNDNNEEEQDLMDIEDFAELVEKLKSKIILH